MSVAGYEGVGMLDGAALQMGHFRHISSSH